MEIRSRITADELAQAYASIGFSPHPTEPDTFQRTSDELVFFHSSIRGEFYWKHVLGGVVKVI